MILEGSADEMHAIGEQCRGEGIVLVSNQSPAVEFELQRMGAIDAATGWRAEGLGHRGAVSPGL